MYKRLGNRTRTYVPVDWPAQRIVSALGTLVTFHQIS
jgi:hypothetical protein